MTDMIEVRKESVEEILSKIGGKKSYYTINKVSDNSVIIDNEVIKEMIIKFMKNFIKDGDYMVPDDIIKLCYHSYISGVVDAIHKVDLRNYGKEV